MNTRELVLRLYEHSAFRPCEKGLAYADAHPDPFEAISYAVSQPTDWGDGGVGGLVRAALDALVSRHRRGFEDAKSTGMCATDLARNYSQIDILAYTHRAGDILRQWAEAFRPALSPVTNTFHLAQRLALLSAFPACPEGLRYAQEHPDPFEAVEYALTQPTTYGDESPGAHVRWAARRISTLDSPAGLKARVFVDRFASESGLAPVCEYTKHAAEIVAMWLCENGLRPASEEVAS